MKTRTLYATIVTLFAAFMTFYAVMTLAFFFGEGRSEWVFLVLIVLISAVTIWSSVFLWRGKNALTLTAISLVIVAGLLGWIIIPPGSWDFSFVMIVILWLISLGLLVGLTSKKVRDELK